VVLEQKWGGEKTLKKRKLTPGSLSVVCLASTHLIFPYPPIM